MHGGRGCTGAVEKANKLVDLLGDCQSTSEFWELYDREIEKKVETVADVRSYREIFDEIEDEFWSSLNKQTKRFRSKDCPSDVASFESYYNVVFSKFANPKKMPELSDFKKVIGFWRQGTKKYKDAYFVLKNIAKRCHNSDALLKELDKIKYRQTIKAEKQSISLEEYIGWRDKAYNLALTMKNRRQGEARLKWLWVTDMVGMYGLRPSELAAALNLNEPYTKDGVIVKAIADPTNEEMLLILGDFTYFGTSIKTGNRVCKPVSANPELIAKLGIRDVRLPVYTPKKGTNSKALCGGFNNGHRNRLISMKCPVTQVYAFRHLYNQLGEQYGIPQEVRARSMGHSTITNDTVYKRRSNFQTTINILTKHSKQPLSLELAKQKLKESGVNTENSLAKLILSVVYQLK